MILDLLRGVAIEYLFLLRLYVRIGPGIRDAAGNYSRPFLRTQEKTRKIPDKMGLFHCGNAPPPLKSSELLVKQRNGLDAAKIIFEGNVLIGCVSVLVGQAEAQ